MIRKLLTPGLLALIGLVAALPAAADIYTVTLTNDETVVSRYQPQEASWDSEMVLLLTEAGNWIGVRRDEIAEVQSETETKGYGLRINTTTLALGWSPNDVEEEGEEGAGGQGGGTLQQFIDEPSSVEQFVEPSEAGGPGLPVYGLPYSFSDPNQGPGFSQPQVQQQGGGGGGVDPSGPVG